MAGANADVTRLLGGVPHLMVRALSLVATVGALALPVALAVRELLRSHLRRLIEGLLTGLVAIGVIGDSTSRSPPRRPRRYTTR